MLLCLIMPVKAAEEYTHTLKRINDSGEINLGYRVSQTPMSSSSACVAGSISNGIGR